MISCHAMFEQEKSVIQLGRNGLAVLLPAIWTRQNHVSKGDKILVEMTEDDLTIRPKVKVSRK